MIKIDVLASGSKGNCYRVTDGSTPLLLECGIPLKEIKQKLNFNLGDVWACLVSHEHKDHSKSAESILKMTAMDVYTSYGTVMALNIEYSRVVDVKHLVQFTVGTWTILPFATEHDAAEPLGYLLRNQTGEKLLFITDSYYCRYKFSGLTHLMIECNYAADILAANVEAGRLPESQKNRLLKSHFSLANVKEFLRANDLSKVVEIHLLHLSDGNSDAARFKREIMELTGKPVYVAAGGGGFEEV